MRRRGLPFDEVERLIGQAREAGLIDDRLFAKLWVEDRMTNRPLARGAIKRELREKGIDPSLVEQAIRSGYPESKEPEVALRLAQSRYDRLRTLPDKEKRVRRLLGFLDRRGFNRDLACRIVNQLEQESEDG